MSEKTLAFVVQQIRSGGVSDHLKGLRMVREVYQDEDFISLLQYTFDEDLDVRSVCVEALGYLSGSEVEDCLLKHLLDDAWEVKWAAIRALGSFWDFSELKKLGHRYHHYRVQTLKLLEKKRYSKLYPIYLSLLDDEDEVIARAIRNLVSLKNEEVVGVFFELFHKTSSPELKARVEEALLHFGKERLIQLREEEKLRCFQCETAYPLSLMKKVSISSDETRWFCSPHFKEWSQQKEPIDGKYKPCKACESHHPKVVLNEGLCPPCRKKIFFFLNAYEDSFRCFDCHKSYPHSAQTVLTPFLEYPICNACSFKQATQSAGKPFLTMEAIQFQEMAFEKGYLLCEKQQVFLPFSSFEDYSEFRRKNVSISPSKMVERKKTFS